MTHSVGIVARGDGWIAANKPHGWSVQSTPARPESLQTRLASQEDHQGGYLTPVHRIDRATAGIVLFATTKRSARLLSQQFATGKVTKFYRATLRGRLGGLPPTTKDEFRSLLRGDLFETFGDGGMAPVLIWEDRVAKEPDIPRARIVGTSESDPGKRCVTEVLAGCCDEDCTDLLLRPRTGRMHQIRIQAASRNHPVLGDTVYDAAAKDSDDGPPRSIDEPSRIVRESPDRIELAAMGGGGASAAGPLVDVSQILFFLAGNRDDVTLLFDDIELVPPSGTLPAERGAAEPARAVNAFRPRRSSNVEIPYKHAAPDLKKSNKSVS